MSANISSELSTIASGIYGKDVRSAIHDAIEKINKSFNEDDNVVYNSIDDIRAAFPDDPETGSPSWAVETIQKLIDKGYLVGGSGNRLSLTYTAIRFLRILDRAGAFDDRSYISPVEHYSDVSGVLRQTLKKLVDNGFCTDFDGYNAFVAGGKTDYDLIEFNIGLDLLRVLNGFRYMGLLDAKTNHVIKMEDFEVDLVFPSAFSTEPNHIYNLLDELIMDWGLGTSITLNTTVASRDYFLRLQALYQEGVSHFLDFTPIPMGSSLAIPRIEVRNGAFGASWYIEDEILAARSITITHDALEASGLELSHIYKIYVGIAEAATSRGNATGTARTTNSIEYTYGTEENPTLDLSTGNLVISWTATSSSEIGDRKVTISDTSGCTVSAYLKPIVAVGEDGFSHWSGTRAEYDALGVYDEDTVYLITGA